MSRPTDWHLVDLGGDPTPGESWGVRALSGAYGNIATIAGEVSTIVDAINTTSRSGIWIGQAGDAFRTKIDSLPDDARKCADSYGIARDAMTQWASKIDDTQARADTGLNQARTAQADLESAQHALTAALSAQSSASSTLRRTENLYDLYRDATPPAGVNVPTDWQVRQARNRAASAATSVRQASGDQADAQARLDAAKRLVQEAKSDYEDGARVIVAEIEQAKDAGVRADSWWESIYHSDAWKVIVAVVTVVVIVAAIVLSGGAALAILAIGGALLLADSLMAWQEGDIGSGEFALAAILTIVPGGKLVGALGKGMRAAEAVGATARGVRSGATPLRSLTSQEKWLYRRPSGFRKGVRDKTWSRAESEQGGIVRDEVTGAPMQKEQPWDMGHKPGFEFRKHQVSAADRQISRRQFLDEHNDPSHYRPELPKSNRGHFGEDMTDSWLGP